MSQTTPTPRWAPPFATQLPAEPGARRRAVVLRVVFCVVLAAFLIVTVVQFQHGTMKNARKAAAAHQEADIKRTKGAIGRWRFAVREFWAGDNIYVPKAEATGAFLFPNMPFTVILLTPFAYLPLAAGTALFNAMKVAALLAAIWMMIRVADHHGARMPAWAAALGVLWAIKPIIGDIQHGNTNVFVLAAIVLHLWLYARGRDWAAGAALALAICLKMTPALFVLYWIYQRSWKVLIGVLVAMVVFAAVVPVAAVGPQRAANLTKTWLDNLIIPGLVKGEWYPIHINQSVSGVVGRYVLGKGQPGGNIFWNPDDMTYDEQEQHGWIAFVSLSPAQARWVVRAVQVVVGVLGAWAIGWRKLPRDDGRRALHYGLVVVGMMLLNQRTWDHHAAVLLVAAVPIWYAIACGQVSRAARGWALGLMVAAAVCLWGSSNGVFVSAARLAGRTEKIGEAWADWIMAYGPVFYHFLMYLVAAVILAVALRRREVPYRAGVPPAGQTSSA